MYSGIHVCLYACIRVFHSSYGRAAKHRNMHVEYVRVYVCMYACIRVPMCACMYINMHVCVCGIFNFVHILGLPDTYTHIHTYIHTSGRVDANSHAH